MENLRILFLNTWGGNVPGYFDWIEEHGAEADVLCLSEVHNGYGPESVDLIRRVNNRRGPVQVKQYQILSDLLRDTHQGYFAEAYRGLHDCESADTVPQGLAMFIRRELRSYGISSTLLNREYDGIHTPGAESGSRVIQSSFILPQDTDPILLCSLHGLWTPGGKVDTESRHIQNDSILDHLCRRGSEPFSPLKGSARVILGGDFNYTSAMAAFSRIKHWIYWGSGGAKVLNEQVPDGFNTRTELYDPDKPSLEADMVFTGRAIDAQLTVDRSVPSDHAALFVDVAL
mgnify:CR=1 FL=1